MNEECAENPDDESIMNAAAKGRLLKRFYEPLVLLHLLDPYNGEQICSPGYDDEDSQVSDQELRRKVLKQLAYMCDYETGGKTVTAIALEESRESGEKVYWLAANRTPREKVVQFLNDILNDLRGLSSASAEEKQREITKKCVQFGMRRIKGYLDRFWTQLDKCIKCLEVQRYGRGIESACPTRSTQKPNMWRYRPRIREMA